MTDTGQIPGEGLPENALGDAARRPHPDVPGHGLPQQPEWGGADPQVLLAPQAAEQGANGYAYLDQPAAPGAGLEDEDDVLLMPGPQGSWSDPQPVPPQRYDVPSVPGTPAGQPLGAEGHAAVESAGGEPAGAGLGSFGPGIAGPGTGEQAAPGPMAAPRRPLHLGPPIVDTPSGGVSVRSLADRGPAVHAPGPPTVGPEYLDVPSDGTPVIPAQQTGEPANPAAPLPGSAWPTAPVASQQSLIPHADSIIPAQHTPAAQAAAPVPAADPLPAVADGPQFAAPAPQVPDGGGAMLPEQAVEAPAAHPAPEPVAPPEPAPEAVAPPQPVGDPSGAVAVSATEPTVSGTAEVTSPPAEPVGAQAAPQAAAAPAAAEHAAGATEAVPGQEPDARDGFAPVADQPPADPGAVDLPAPQPAEQAAPLPAVAAAPTAEPSSGAAAEGAPVPGFAMPLPPVVPPVEIPVAPPAAVPAPQPAAPAEAATPVEATAPVEPGAEDAGAAPVAAGAPTTLTVVPDPVGPDIADARAVPDDAPTGDGDGAGPDVQGGPVPVEPEAVTLDTLDTLGTLGTLDAPEQQLTEAGTAGEAEAGKGRRRRAAPAEDADAAPDGLAADAPPRGDGLALVPPPDPGTAAEPYEPAVRDAVHRVIRERRDIRNGFRSDPIPHDVLLRVLEAAHTAPSVGHSQPWDFVVIRSEKTREKMHGLAMLQREAYAKSLPKGRARQFRELKIEAILDTPVNIVVTADPTRGGRHTLGRHTQPQMAPYSSALAVENLWLAARAEGLGVGWVSFFDERQMVAELGLPEHLEVVAYLCVGYVDEFPDEPELMQAGWSKRRPLSWVVHEEEYGNRALPGEEPHDLLEETLRGIRPLDAKALGEAWERQKRMTKPAGALGMLEIISAQLSGLSRQCPPPIPEPAAVAIFAGDHGVHAQGVTSWPQEVTAQMVANFLGGGAVCNAFANQVGAEVCVIDVGVASELPTTPGLLPRKVRPGTADFTVGPAMSREEALRAIEIGIETARDLVAAGNKALLTGEMGIANTTVSAVLIAVFTGADPAEVTGRGTGINDEMHARKVEVVRRALELHRPDPADPIAVLAAVGGLEHAAIVGLLLGAAALRTPVILDGVSAGAAALVARAIAPEVLAACIAGHRSAEPGHVAALTTLGLRPLVDLDLRLGEGTGALLALPLVQSAARVMHEVATFDAAGVTEKG
ncbi:nicotinate-nucleotide--dimethylbenzimidazole phosphoribosyltransferase [Streptomyces sp. NBC_01190]|uniref:nicotinate-nucleotide--dimethylbenzimidazole phosphoribosyltransferase n=1 Tax=Streptomyces sp. NBC_01190 TaxID=2903767 RepID=UPI0038693573|nr:nicotinate-nucleotide--dimethylbenzimidazole phosphoribosyltransferase [Streptomyces sp. NBC_01190]